MATQIASPIKNLIWPILMGECPGCGNQLEFGLGRCAKSDYDNFQDAEQKLIEWIIENQQNIKDVLAQQKQIELQVQKMDWRGYDDEVSILISTCNLSIRDYINQLCRLIPVLGLTTHHDNIFNNANHLIHILDRISCANLEHCKQALGNPVIILKPRPFNQKPSSLFPSQNNNPELLKESYHQQTKWYQWMVDYTRNETEKTRRELIGLQKLVDIKELELADLEAEHLSLGDILETYRELSGERQIDPDLHQKDCFD